MESAQAADPQTFGSNNFKNLPKIAPKEFGLYVRTQTKRRTQQASAAVVNSAVTSCAEGDQIEFTIIARLATCQEVVDLKLGLPATSLTPPPIALQDPSTQLLVSFRIKLNPGLLGAGKNHAISARSPVRNWCFCSPGKNL